MTEKANGFNKQQQNDENEKSSAVFQNYREILPSQFIDQVFYSYVLCQYGDDGEELLDQVSESLDKKLREAMHDYFIAIDELSMIHLKPALKSSL
jgi:hypothetical protein